MRLQDLCSFMIIMLWSYVVTSLAHEKSFLLQDGASTVFAIGLYKNSLLMSTSNDVVQRDIQTGLLQRTFRAHDQPVFFLVVTNDSKMITSGDDDMIIIWDLVTASILRRIRLRLSDSRIESLAIKNDLVIAGGSGNKVAQVDLVTGRITRTIGNSKQSLLYGGF